MFETCILLSPLIAIFLASHTEFENPTLKKIQSYIFIPQTKILSAEDLFRLSMMQGRYLDCIDLLQADQKPLNLNLKDYNLLLSLQSVEKNAVSKKDAQNCATFLYHYLCDHKIIRPSRPSMRPSPTTPETHAIIVDTKITTVHNDTLGIKGRFFNAIANNDTQTMQSLIATNRQLPLEALNQMEPIEFAIARSNKEAIECLYQHGVIPKIEHLERATTFTNIIRSNSTSQEEDFKFTDTTRTEGYQAAISQCKAVENIIQNSLL